MPSTFLASAVVTNRIERGLQHRRWGSRPQRGTCTHLMETTVLFTLSASATAAPPSGPRLLNARLREGVAVNYSCFRGGTKLNRAGCSAAGIKAVAGHALDTGNCAVDLERLGDRRAALGAEVVVLQAARACRPLLCYRGGNKSNRAEWPRGAVSSSVVCCPWHTFAVEFLQRARARHFHHLLTLSHVRRRAPRTPNSRCSGCPRVAESRQGFLSQAREDRGGAGTRT